MRSWAGLAAGAALAVLALPFLQCGGGTSEADPEPEIPLPDRVAPVDGGLDTGVTPIDAADGSASPCDLTKPFGKPITLPELDAPSHRATPRLSGDELSIYFTTAGAMTAADLSTA